MALMESLKIGLGTPALDFSLPGIDGKIHALAEYKDAKNLVVVFMCNHCPYVQAVWERLVKLQEKYLFAASAGSAAGQGSHGVQFVGINPNLNPDYPEESLEKMKEYSAKYKMNFPYLLDESQQVAKAYKAQCTPDIFVFDSERKLAYHGRIDDNWKEPSKVTNHELDQALTALIKGQETSELQHPSMGCSIKWRE